MDDRRGWCRTHGVVEIDLPPDGHVADDGPGWEMGHAPGCWGSCERHGCPVQVQADPRYQCGPVYGLTDRIESRPTPEDSP